MAAKLVPPSTPRREVYDTRVVIMRVRRDSWRGRVWFVLVVLAMVAGAAFLLTHRPRPAFRPAAADATKDFRPLQGLLLPPAAPPHTVVEVEEDPTPIRPVKHVRKRLRVALERARTLQLQSRIAAEVSSSMPAPEVGTAPMVVPAPMVVTPAERAQPVTGPMDARLMFGRYGRQ